MGAGDINTAEPLFDPAGLLPLALSRPQDALTAARSLLASGAGACDASFARQAIGIVLRDRGDLRGAIDELRKGVLLARASGDPEREADVQATLGATLAWTGRIQQGLALLNRAVDASHGVIGGRVLMRRASVLKDLGRFHEAHQDLSRALPAFRRAEDTVWEARSLIHRADIFLSLGLPGRASADYVHAEALFAANGQVFEYAKARHSLGLVALARGDLPAALAYFDEAATRYDELGETLPDLAIDRCWVLLDAGLTTEAVNEADAALGDLPPGGGIAFRRAELLFTGATAALAAGQLAEAKERAAQARRLFRTHRRPLWEARARLVMTQARYAEGQRSARLLRQAEEAACRLDAARLAEATQAHLLAGRIALSLDRSVEADQHLGRAARSRRHGPPLARSVAWLARALQADAHGNPRAVVAACGRGLDALDEHQMRLGATELRAYGTAHGAELATLAQRKALSRGDVRRLLLWSERWRATALAVRSSPQRDDKDLAAELEALRGVTRLLEADEMNAPRRNALERERRRLEAAVQARTRRSPGRSGPGEGTLDLGALFAELGDSTLAELVTVDGILHVIVVAGRRVRLHTVGPVPEREVEMNRFVLRRLAHGPPRPGDELALKHRGAKLEAALLGEAAAHLPDGPVVVVPPASLPAVPWTLMPSLRARPVTVAPSASTWLRARRTRPPTDQRVALVVGPGLATKGAEVAELHSRYPQAVVLGQAGGTAARGSATAGQVLAALDGAWLGHVAAHGRFRADNPMFSAILLDDGPMTVHDFERLSRAPYQLVLSSCDSAVAAAVGADELLGLVSSLVPMGAAGIVASVVPVNDLAAVPLMLALHRALQQGAGLPEAMRAARQEAADDPVAQATAHSFTALGA